MGTWHSRVNVVEGFREEIKPLDRMQAAEEEHDGRGGG
jgi:hypothetical protein